MFTLTRSGIRNILFNARLHNPAQLTFCPAQIASKKALNFPLFSHTLSEDQGKRSMYTNCVMMQRAQQFTDFLFVVIERKKIIIGANLKGFSKYCKQEQHFPIQNIFYPVKQIFKTLHYANEGSNEVISVSSKTVQHSINILQKYSILKAVFFKLGNRNEHHKRNKITPAIVTLP